MRERKRERIVLVPESLIWNIDTVVRIINTTIQQTDRVKNAAQRSMTVPQVLIMKRWLLAVVLRSAALSLRGAGHAMVNRRVINA